MTISKKSDLACHANHDRSTLRPKPDPDLDDPKPGFSIRIEQVSGFSDTRNQSGAQTKGFTPFFSSKEAFQV